MSAGRTGLGAAVTAALLVWVAAPAVPQSASSASGKLPGGVRYTLQADPGQTEAAVALWFRAPGSGFEAPALPGLARLAAAAVSGSRPVAGTPLGTLVGRFGGTVAVNAYPDSVAVTAIVPPDRVAQVVRAMTQDYFAPVLDDHGLELARREVGDDALRRSFEPQEAVENALGTALFSSGPMHEGVLGSAQGLREVPLASVRRFAERAFAPANAILVLSGRVDDTALAGVAVREGAPSLPEEPAALAVRAPRPALALEANTAGIGLGWTGPKILDEADATALDFLADVLFAPRSGLVQRALGARSVDVTGRFVTYRDPGVFFVTIAGDDAGAARPVVEHAIAAAAAPLDAAAFDAARAAFIYRMLRDTSMPADIADTLGWYAVEGDETYAPAAEASHGRYYALAAALTPQSVARVAARYLGAPPAVVTLARSKPAPQKP